MAWTTPKTAVTFETVTAADWNTHVRDNLLETEPAKMTEAGTIVMSDGENSIVPRKPASASVLTEEWRTETTYGDMATPGPAVTVTTGSQAIVVLSAYFWNNTPTNQSFISYEVSGATTLAPDDNRALCWEQSTVEALAMSRADLLENLTPGTNTFTMKYRQAGQGTGSDKDIQALARHIMVIPI